MKPSQDLTEEEIAQALAEAQGWADSQDYPNLGYLPPSWVSMEHDGCHRVHAIQDEYPTDSQYCALILNPEIQAGYKDVLDEWLTDGFDEGLIGRLWWHHPEYQSNPRLWDLRAIVEYLRRKQKGREDATV